MVPCQRGLTMSDTISIVGNVATDPKQHTPGGVPITSFRLAVSQRRLDKSSGEWVDASTNWYSISAFRGLGEHALSSIKKGDRIFVKGRLRIRDWTAGEKSGTSAEVEAETLGHDLLWGTTVFTKAGSSGQRPPEAHGGGAGGAGVEQWHVPMGDSGSAGSALATAALTDQSLQAMLEGASGIQSDEPAMALAESASVVTPF